MNVVFDLGGTYLRCAVDRAGGALSDLHRVRIDDGGLREPSSRVWPELLEKMNAYVERASAAYGAPESIVVAFPGPIAETRTPMCAPTVAGSDLELPAFSFGDGGVPIYVLNDVSAAAWHLGAVTGYDRFLVVTVSSGIGSKVYDRSRAQPVIDDEPFAGELGHLVVDASPQAPMCDCGVAGHLGAIASGRGVERLARHAAKRDADAFSSSLCAQWCRDPNALTNEAHIVPAVRAGDSWAISIVREASSPLASVLATAIVLCGLRKVVVIGGFACAIGDGYAALLDASVRQRLAPRTFGLPDSQLVEVWDPNEEACLYGAALFAREQSERRICVS